jgi:nickel transport protein
MNKSRLAILISIAALLVLAMPAAAHKVNVFGYVEGGQIQGEGYFPGGGKAKGCKVELLDSMGQVLAQTKTDAKGVFKLKLPQAEPPLKLVLTAGMGHKGEYLLTAQELGQPTNASKPEKAEKRNQVSQFQDANANAASGLDENQIKEIVGKALEEKLAPLQAQIARMNAERAIGVADVIGGLGYILGLLGLAAYMKSRKQ